ncbi:MAG: nucleotidyltransferase [Acidobacteriota bacterium]|nr:nucleotidyltransferase [Acidobacteriota bacterium]
MIDFEKTLTLLSDAGVHFVIIGGLAITIHGSSYVTFDLDLCYARDDENLARLAGALRQVNPRLRGAPASLPFNFDEETLKRGLNFTLTTDVGDLDLIGEVVGVGDYRAAAAASLPVELFGREYAVLTLDALIASKRAAGRPKDLQALPELEALREATEGS